MVAIDDNGTLVFTLHHPTATRVEVVGTFHGWHEESRPMTPTGEGRFVLKFDPGPGVFLFRYRIDGDVWRTDDAAHGLVRGADGVTRSRVWRPTATQITDPQAA